MENKSHAFAAGLFVLILGALTLLAISWLAGDKEDTHDYIVVTKQNISGLNPQAQVRYRGIRVGKVSDIRLDPEDDSNILITISISDDVPLTKGTVAKLNYQGVTGLAHILLLETGKNREPLIPDDNKPPQIVMIPSLFEEVAETGMATLKQAKQLLANANELLDHDNRQRLTATLVNLEAATAGLKPVIGKLDSTLVQVNKVLSERNVEQLSSALSETGPLLADTRQLLGRVQVATERFDAAIGDAGGGGLAALMPRLNDMSQDVSQTSRQLGRVLRMVEDTPQGLVFGTPAVQPGPGEPGFGAEGGR